MRRFVDVLARVVREHPVLLIAALLVATAGFGRLAGEAQTTAGNEGFSPDNAELQALETVQDRFAASDDITLQVVVRATDGGDVISPDGFATVQAVQQAILGSDAASALSQREGQPPFVSFLVPVQAALAPPGQQPGGQQPSGPVPLPEGADVDALYQQGLTQLPPQQAGLFQGLLAEGADVEASRADAGLLLVFLDPARIPGAQEAEGFSSEAVAEVEQTIIDAVRDAEVPAGFEARPFAFEVLFADQGAFESEVGRLFGMAFLIILAILGFVYWIRPGAGPRMTVGRAIRRTVADVALTLLVILLSIVWMQGIGVALGPDYLGVIGAFSPPTQIVPILLIGLGVDYAIHLTSRYREELGLGESPTEAASRASRTVGIALVLATVTTAVGFLTNVTNPLPAITDFGILAAVGIGSAFLLMLTLVPAARLLLDRRAEAGDRLPHDAMRSTSERALPELMAKTSVLARRWAYPTLAVTLVLAALGAFGLTRLSTEFSFTDFVPQDDPQLETLQLIEDEFGGGFAETTEILIQGDVASPTAHNALLATLGNLRDTSGVVQFGDQPAAESVVSVLAQLVAPPEGEAGGQAPAPEFAQTAFAAGLQPDLTVAPDADVARIYDALLQAAPEQAGAVLARDEGGGFTTLVDVQTQAGESGALDLRSALRDDVAPLRDAGLEVTPTSQNIVGGVIVRELQNSQIVSLIVTLVAATLLLVATFWVQVRRPFLGVITIAPVVLVVLWTFGLMAATGIPFGPITAVLSALAIGIGVPFTIHITHRFEEDRARYDDPADAIASTVRHTGGALAGSALTTMAGFGILTTSSLVPFRQMGQVTAYAIGFAFIASVLVLPSMLVLWDGWHRRRGDAIEHLEV